MAKAKEYLGQEYATATQGKGLRQDSLLTRIVTRVTVTFSVLVMVVSVGIITCCAIFFMSPIMGTSMMVTLNATGENTDSAIACRVTTPHRGDIVITKLYAHQSKDVDSSDANYLKQRYPMQDANGRYMHVIKRLIAVGGDQITVERTYNPAYGTTNHDNNYDYTIYLNGEKLDEPYLDPTIGRPNARNFIQLYNILNNPAVAVHNDWKATNEDDCITPVLDADGNPVKDPSGIPMHVLTIPEGYHFYLGDNRGGKYDTNPEWAYSWDCCQIGPLPANQYVGTCVEVIDQSVNLPTYVWHKIVYYVFFGWAWQK